MDMDLASSPAAPLQPSKLSALLASKALDCARSESQADAVGVPIFCRRLSEESSQTESIQTGLCDGPLFTADVAQDQPTAEADAEKLGLGGDSWFFPAEPSERLKKDGQAAAWGQQRHGVSLSFSSSFFIPALTDRLGHNAVPSFASPRHHLTENSH
jgi:hypothetical protein